MGWGGKKARIIAFGRGRRFQAAYARADG